MDEKLAALRQDVGEARLVKVVVDRDGFMLDVEQLEESGESQMQSRRFTCVLRQFGGVKRRLGAGGTALPPPDEPDADLLLRVARARRWAEEIETGKRSSALEIAAAEHLRAGTVMRDLGLAWTSPAELEVLIAAG